MKRKSILAALLLLLAGLQTAWAQGFRVYKSDGTVAQFSMRTDSIVFYDDIGTDVDFGPFTPVNQCIAGTWYKSKSESVTFREDGTTDYVSGATYKFFPYQGTIIIYNASGAPMNILKVHELTAEQMIATPEGGTFSVWSTTPPPPVIIDEHEYVDLGLPSGTLWATCNVGASKPEEYGDYFAWGETKPKSIYNWSTYKWCNGSSTTMTKYCTRSEYGNNGFTDNLTELQPEDDAATANWGSGWKMPSLDQIKELFESYYTTSEWTQLNGVYGYKITSKSNGNSIFLPAAGERLEDGLYYAGKYGNYWSSSLGPNDDNGAYFLYFGSGIWDWDEYGRGTGHSVRAVRVQE